MYAYTDIFSFLSSRVYFTDIINTDTIEEILMSNEDMYMSYRNLSEINQRRLANDVKISFPYYQ